MITSKYNDTSLMVEFLITINIYIYIPESQVQTY